MIHIISDMELYSLRQVMTCTEKSDVRFYPCAGPFQDLPLKR